MSGTVQQLIETAQHIPHVEHPIEALAAMGGAAGLYAWMRHGYENTDEAVAARFHNAELLAQTVSRDPEEIRRQRLGGTLLTIVGVGLAVASLAGRPHVTADVPNSGAHLVFVEDASYSQRYTRDVGGNTSRYDAVARAMSSADFAGNLGVVQFGGNTQTTLPPTKNWEDHKITFTKPVADPNGGELVQALQGAESLLPLSGGRDKREGTIVLATDGTVSDSNIEVAQEVAKLKADGVNFRVIVTGTGNAEYRINGQTPVDSGVQPEIFSNVADKDLKQAHSADAIKSAIHAELKDAGSEKEDQTWYWGLVAGGIAGATGLAKMFKRVRNRWI